MKTEAMHNGCEMPENFEEIYEEFCHAVMMDNKMMGGGPGGMGGGPGGMGAGLGGMGGGSGGMGAVPGGGLGNNMMDNPMMMFQAFGYKID